MKNGVDAHQVSPTRSRCCSADRVQALDTKSVFIRFQKITGSDRKILAAAKHNLRELPPAQHIDHSLSALNVRLAGEGSALAVMRDYRQRLKNAGITHIRSNGVLALEVVVSLTVGIVDASLAYFRDSLRWLSDQFGEANILSAVVHQDEAAQHMHVLITPLVNGRMNGSSLMGGPSQLKARRAAYVEAMASHFVRLGISVRMPASMSKEDMARAVLRELSSRDDALFRSHVFDVMRDQIYSDPQPFFEKLCLQAGHQNHSSDGYARSREKANRTFTQIFIKPVKGMRGSKAERYRESVEFKRASVVSSRVHQQRNQTEPKVEIDTGVVGQVAPSKEPKVAPKSIQSLCSVCIGVEHQSAHACPMCVRAVVSSNRRLIQVEPGRIRGPPSM